jgi:hypothetical protein
MKKRWNKRPSTISRAFASARPSLTRGKASRNLLSQNRIKANNIISNIMGQGYANRKEILDIAQHIYKLDSNMTRLVAVELDKIGIFD